MDGRNDRFTTPFALAWDGKATLSKSVSITRDMWAKAVEQAHGEIPLVALRFYANERLGVDEDLVVLRANDFASILEAARAHQQSAQRPVADGLVDRPADQSWLEIERGKKW
jgi:hypothetical protein